MWTLFCYSLEVFVVQLLGFPRSSRFQDFLSDAIYVGSSFHVAGYLLFLTQDPVCFIGGELYAAEEVGGCWDW